MRARLFMSGRSQALRLPARLRLRGSEVEIEPMGDALWVQPCHRASDGLAQWLETFYAEHPPLPETFLQQRDDQPPQERDWG
jgi:antitoxin VapB